MCVVQILIPNALMYNELLIEHYICAHITFLLITLLKC